MGKNIAKRITIMGKNVSKKIQESKKLLAKSILKKIGHASFWILAAAGLTAIGALGTMMFLPESLSYITYIVAGVVSCGMATGFVFTNKDQWAVDIDSAKRSIKKNKFLLKQCEMEILNAQISIDYNREMLSGILSNKGEVAKDEDTAEYKQKAMEYDDIAQVDQLENDIEMNDEQDFM